jgi:capsular polysaccharide transport system permease protein
MSSTAVGRGPKFSSSLATQIRVTVALMVREAQAKYSQETLGFFWTIGEPLVLTCGVILLWSASGRREGPGAVPIFALAVTAYTHIQLWRLVVLQSISSIKMSGWLYYHQNVRMFDVFLARSLLLSVSIFTSFVIISSVGALFGFMPPVRDWGMTIAAWCVDMLFVMSFATVIAGLSEFSEIVEKFLHPLMYLTLPLTGAFIMTSWMPPRARFIVEWSPLANVCEMFRYGVFPLTVKTIWNLPFVLACTLVLFVIGIPLMTKARTMINVQ